MGSVGVTTKCGYKHEESTAWQMEVGNERIGVLELVWWIDKDLGLVAAGKDTTFECTQSRGANC